MKWKLISGSPNYASECGQYIAVYKHSYGGFGNYWTFRSDLPARERKLRNFDITWTVASHQYRDRWVLA